VNWARRSIFAVVSLSAVAAIIAATARTDRRRDSHSQQTITWLVPMQLDRPLLERLAQQFRSENSDIDLRLVFCPGAQYQTKLKTLIASGHAPDMFYCGDVWVAYLRPFLLDLTPLFSRDAAEIGMDDIYPKVLDACRSRGQYLFIPRWFSVSLLYYNRKLFDDAHEAYPAAHARPPIRRRTLRPAGHALPARRAGRATRHAALHRQGPQASHLSRARIRPGSGLRQRANRNGACRPHRQLDDVQPDRP
jgi:maltose-binding protein MalE